MTHNALAWKNGRWLLKVTLLLLWCSVGQVRSAPSGEGTEPPLCIDVDLKHIDAITSLSNGSLFLVSGPNYWVLPKGEVPLEATARPVTRLMAPYIVKELDEWHKIRTSDKTRQIEPLHFSIDAVFNLQLRVQHGRCEPSNEIILYSKLPDNRSMVSVFDRNDNLLYSTTNISLIAPFQAAHSVDWTKKIDGLAFYNNMTIIFQDRYFTSIRCEDGAWTEILHKEFAQVFPNTRNQPIDSVFIRSVPFQPLDSGEVIMFYSHEYYECSTTGTDPCEGPYSVLSEFFHVDRFCHEPSQQNVMVIAFFSFTLFLLILLMTIIFIYFMLKPDHFTYLVNAKVNGSGRGRDHLSYESLKLQHEPATNGSGGESKGLTTYILGPALDELQSRVNTDLEHMSYVIGSIGILYMFGALINGTLYNYFNRQFLLAILLLFFAIDIALAPYCTQLYQLFLVTIVAGFVSGGFDTAAIVWTIDLWSSDAPIYLLGNQFAYSLGTFVSPQISRPFLSKNITVVDAKNQSLTHKEKTTSHIEIPFGIVGGFLLSVSLLMMVSHFYRRYSPPRQSTSTSSGSTCQMLSKYHLVSILLSIFMIGPYVGMEITNFQLIPLYSKHSYLHFDDQVAALTQSIMAGAFALARGLLILLVLKVRPQQILPVFYVLIALGNTFVVLCSHYQWSKWVFWASQACLGAGFSVVLTSTYSYIEQHLEITDSVGGIFVCSGGTMIAIFCTICTSMIDTTTLIVYWFNYGSLATISSMFVLFTLWQRAHRESREELSETSSTNNHFY